MNEIETEIWKPLKYYRVKLGMYEVSNFGRVRNRNTGRILAQCLSEKGYPMVLLMCVNNMNRTIKTHRIVAVTFVKGYSKEKSEVDHIDGNKQNNHASNLEWVSRKENIRRGFDKGLIPALRGELNGRTKTDESTVRTICEKLVENNLNCGKIYYDLKDQDLNNLSLGLIHDIKYKKRWVHVSDEYFKRTN